MDKQKNERLLKLATRASVATAVVLILVKLGAWWVTESVAVMASLIDSMMDGVASTLNLIAVRLSLQPADEDHRFGHGKAEPLAGLAQAAFVVGSAVFLMLHAVDRLIHPQPVLAAGVGIGVMVFAAAATLVLLAIQRHAIKATGSTAIRADSLHYAADLLTYLSVIVALFLAGLGMPGADPLMAIVIAAFILFSAWKIARDAIDMLMDRELPDEDKETIFEIGRRHSEVAGIHELRMRRSGQTYIIQLHLEMAGDISLAQAHAISDEVEEEILEKFPGADVLIHQDPVTS
ncbi:MAG: cation diffusion facilitator family transporter [Gammaproteobacteria bacterium]|nr:cation diffusion facilitator family transporter [Gammaproteobacteria bacterium]